MSSCPDRGLIRMTTSSSRRGAIVAFLIAVTGVVAACGGSTTAGGSSTTTACRLTPTVSSPGAAASKPDGRSRSWLYPNADLANTRDATGSTISSSNVSRLVQAWTFKLTGSVAKGLGPYGSLTATPIVRDGVVYLQDLDSNVYAIALTTGKLRWEYGCNQPEKSGPGPNGVAVVNGRVYGLTPTTAFALNATTGHQVWANPHLLGAGQGTFGSSLKSRTGALSGKPIRLRARRRGAARAERVDWSGALEVQHRGRRRPGRTVDCPRRRRRLGDAAGR